MQGANRQISGRNPPEPRSFALHRQSEGRKQHVDLFHTYLCEHTFVMEERDASALAAGDTFSSQTAEGDEHRAQPLEPTLASFPTIPRPIARCFVALASLFDSCSNYDACRCTPFTPCFHKGRCTPSTRAINLAAARRCASRPTTTTAAAAVAPASPMAPSASESTACGARPRVRRRRRTRR